MLGPEEREFLIQFRRALRGMSVAIDRYIEATNKKYSSPLIDEAEALVKRHDLP